MLVLIRLKLTCSGTAGAGPLPSPAGGGGSASRGRGLSAAHRVGRIGVLRSDSPNTGLWSSGTPSLALNPLRQAHHSSGDPHCCRLRSVSCSISR
jgi:hypothetical protein